jgi:nucleotide-binding universal stress UspA family protein
MPEHRKFLLREILTATDFSPTSHQAFEAALALARHFGARLHIVHVVSDGSKQDSALDELTALAPEQTGARKIVKSVLVGHAAPEIVKYAGREKIDLIVLGTHGRGGVARVLMGSVAETVVRTAPCQVLTIGPQARPAEVTMEAAETTPVPLQNHCLVCAKPSQETICDTCKAHIQGEALERKWREEKAGHRGIAV